MYLALSLSLLKKPNDLVKTPYFTAGTAPRLDAGP